MANHRSIEIHKARVNNLKAISCAIAHESFTVITGPSGSGKSSLAFDTLYAEGQRRFLESVSTYARQFMQRIEKPDVDQIVNVLPTIALEQKNAVKNARSTVGTATEIYDFLRLLYATVGQLYDKDGNPIALDTSESIQRVCHAKPSGTKLVLTASVVLDQYSTLEALIAQGYFRAYVDGAVHDLNTGLPQEVDNNEALRIVIDRLVLKGKDTDGRLPESLRKALELNPNCVEAFFIDKTGDTVCQAFQTALDDPDVMMPTPHLFAFNSPLGACKACEGFGKIISLDLDKVIPNRQRTLESGAVHPFTMPSNQDVYDAMMREGQRTGIRMDVPYDELNDAEKSFVLEGQGRYPGVYGFFDWLESKKYKVHVRVMLAKYRGYYQCPECEGSRLRPEALRVKVSEHTIHELCQLPIVQLQSFFSTLTLSDEAYSKATRLLREIESRLDYLVNIGLGYLTLARQSRTLSGGEAQRINLASALGSALTDTLYVLDEPTVGLHSRDTEQLIGVLKQLRDYGNTVVVVEHDPDMIVAADSILDLGPVGGNDGGYVVYEGDVPGLLKTEYSKTAQYLSQPMSLKQGHKPEKEPSEEYFSVLGAQGNNLKQIDVTFPMQQLVCVTGVSGSGKSTLVKQTLYANYQRTKGAELTLDALPCVALEGLEVFEDVILVDQSPPGRSMRSNPVTYVKAYDDIRKLFASTRQAQALGITPSQFSFNSQGGRCDTCEGLGTVTIDMQFMADVTVVCPDCQGKRFTPSVLAIEVEGKTIDDVLNMTVDEALEFFQRTNRLAKKLLPLSEIGLGYLKLGQSTSTLSGGEAQRLKLASYLSSGSKSAKKPYLFLFDEPTTGLHVTDIDNLVAVFRKLLSYGHSLVVIEHNIDLIAQADTVIDLGPEGGEAGGDVLVQGTIADVMACKTSYTGHYLRERFKQTATSH